MNSNDLVNNYENYFVNPVKVRHDSIFKTLIE